MPVSTDDHIAVADHLARYCHFIDDGRTAEWTALWTADGSYTLAGNAPVVGAHALGSVVQQTQAGGRGMIRHLIGNLTCAPGETADTIVASFYNLVTRWSDGARIVTQVACTALLLRDDRSWLIARMDLVPASA